MVRLRVSSDFFEDVFFNAKSAKVFRKVHEVFSKLNFINLKSSQSFMSSSFADLQKK